MSEPREYLHTDGVYPVAEVARPRHLRTGETVRQRFAREELARNVFSVLADRATAIVRSTDEEWERLRYQAGRRAVVTGLSFRN